MRTLRGNPMRRREARGAVLVEFLFVSTVLMLIIFMGLGFGLALSEKDVLAEGLHMAVRDAAVKPGGLVIPVGAGPIYDDPMVWREQFTAIDVTGLGAAAIDAIFNGLPSAHRIMRTAMFTETRNFGAGDRTILRFPGVMLRNPGTGALVVRVPQANGATTDLLRIVQPPNTAALAGSGLIQMEGNFWHRYTLWLLGGSATTLPAGFTGSTVPAGFTAVIDNGITGTYRATRMRAMGTFRKEVQ